MAIAAREEQAASLVIDRAAPAGKLDYDRSLLLGTMVLLACGIEGVLIVLVRRLSLQRYPTVVPTPQPLATALGISERGLTWFLLSLAVLTACYLGAYAVALRITEPRAGVLAIAISAVFIATMLPIFPAGAHDVYHNAVDARTLWVYHENPSTTPPLAHPQDPLVRQLVYWQDLTSSYGPVWYIVSGVPLLFVGEDLVANVVGQKALVSLFLFGTIVLVYLIVRERRPRSATAAMVLLGWSPLVLWEIPGNAHNDIVMMFFAVAALYALHKGRWQWAFPMLALAVGVKFIMLLLGPLLLVWLLRHRPRLNRQELLFSIAASAALLVVIYLPFVSSSHSLANYDALKDRYISSPASLFIAFAMQYTSLARASNLARYFATVLFLTGYVWLLVRRHDSLNKLYDGAFWATFLTLTLPTWWFWPWYVVWLLPLAALTAGRKPATVAAIFGSTALLVYPIYYWRDVILNGPNWYANQVVIVGAVFGPLLVYLLATSGLGLLTVASPEPDETLTAV